MRAEYQPTLRVMVLPAAIDIPPTTPEANAAEPTWTTGLHLHPDEEVVNRRSVREQCRFAGGGNSGQCGDTGRHAVVVGRSEVDNTLGCGDTNTTVSKCGSASRGVIELVATRVGSHSDSDCVVSTDVESEVVAYPRGM